MKISHSTQTFDVIGLQAADLPHAGLAAAFARSGGLALLDLEFVVDADRASRNFAQLCSNAGSRLGLRVTAGSAKLAKQLLNAAGERTLTVVLAGTDNFKKLRKDAGLRAGDLAWAEITDPSQLAAAANCDGIVARGHESGGWVGEYTSYILLQKLAGQTALPIVVQGGIGVHSTAACRIAGAAGVVLDDQMLLLAESPLPLSLQNEFARLNGSETRLFGELLDRTVRVYNRPGSAALKTAEEDNRQAEGGLLSLDDWQSKTACMISWAGGSERLFPLGQGIGLAAAFRKRYGSVAKLVQAIRRASRQQIEQAASLRFIAENGALAASHGTRFPLAQGPMTRVSDSPDFAVEVAKGGALPFLALALMRGPQVREMLEQTRDRIGDKPWGVGMLGFIPHSLREEQCAEIWKCAPPFALIAGGRPDQAAEFEKRGIKTYIHAPAPALLKMYLEQGARRFVFEGRECGGHIGPLASFTLWEEMIDVLLEHVKPGEDKDIHVLFAGGVHDAMSGAMVAAMTAPLAARGMKVGALMGTAYLFTEEIVSTGAIVGGFQEQALACARTKNLETGPGHATRCADTGFAAEFFDKRRELIRAGRSAEEIRDELEDLNLGRLRVASKGINRDAEGKIVEIDAATQISDGMYMIGQVATLRDARVSIEKLHGDVCRGAQDMLAPATIEPRAETPSDVAIIGIGVVLPKADTAEDYWNNLLNKVSVIREVPESRWDWKLFFDQNRKVRDKVYSRWGGFLEEIHFDPTRFGIPPKSMKSIDPMQLLALEGASRALDDAGYGKGGFDRETTSVILGASGGAGELGLQYGLRAELPRFVENISDEVWERLPEWTEESFAGVLPNVAAGRISNRLDFGGINLTVDAACASSLAAISMAVTELESGRSSMVLAGGFDTTQSIYGFTTFAKTQALSPSGKPKTFDQGADGIAISEGTAIVVLKRLADAERDGDRIYAVIKSAAGSSDGKALGLTAPRSEGQVRALNRAYGKAGFSPATLGLVEAHGTGTAVGDRAEAQTITRALAAENAEPASVALGSVKTLLGHTKAAAGVAGMAKVALALYHRVLPAHAGVDKPIDTLANPKSAAYLLKEPRPWLAHPQHPRRGGASAFGFGGTNFHVVLEEHAASAGAAGAQRWPHELCLFGAADTAALTRELQTLRGKLGDGHRLMLAELACALARKAETQAGKPVALAIVCSDSNALARDLDTAIAHLQAGGNKPLPPHIRLSTAVPASAAAVAFLFPGQGAQHLNMGREVGLFVDEIRDALEFADRQLDGKLPQRLSTLMMPAAAFDDATETAQTRALTNTRVAQPAIGALSMGYLQFARRLGLEPVATAGHSYGEYTALLAAGVIDAETFMQLSAVRGAAMADASQTSESGAMVAVQGRREIVAAQIAGFAGISIANHNAPEQCVVSGPKAQIEQAAEKLSAAGLRTVMLPVSGAFHTQLVAPAKAALTTAIKAAQFGDGRCAVYSNQTAQRYPATASAIRALLDQHMLSPVEFVAQIDAMYASGSRLFVELGPKGIVSNMARQTLAGKDATAVSLDGNGGGMRGLLIGLAELFVAGAAWQPSALFARRDLALLDDAQLDELAKPLVVPKHMWLLSGGCARPIADPVLRSGSLPPLTAASAEAARAAQTPRVAHMPAAAPSAASMSAPTLPAAQAVPTMAGEALVAYQQTMRQFLSLQERVLQQYLGGNGATMPSLPTVATAPLMSAPATHAAAIPAMPATPAPTPAVVAAPVAAAAAPAFDAQQSLLTIVAERTGYPSEMLELDADLEADLGIDSIKRVEILGAFQKAMPANAATQMQAQMEAFTKAKSLNAILAQAKTLPLTSSAASMPAAAPMAPAATAAPTLDLQSLLIGIVAERTGYPNEMLGLDADLEADLGIDSIKRVEILGAFQKALPADAGTQMQASMEHFTKAKSLSAILSQAGHFTISVTASVATSATTSASASAPAAVAAPAVDYASLLSGIVAERTGYPPEMLALDADLEADLGIDSIKRVEILGAVQKSLPADAGAQMQAGMERFTKAKSLSAILAELQKIAPAAAAAPQVSVTVNVAPTAAAPVVDYSATLTALVAERTGYPVEMLAFDADLEADLGIDSIKRVEILGAMQKQLSAAQSAQMQATMETFTKAKSLQAIVQALSKLEVTPATAPAAAPTSTTPSASKAATVFAATPRYVIKSRPAPMPEAHADIKGLALLLGGPAPIAKALAAKLKTQGLTPVQIAESGVALRDAVAAARKKHGAVCAVLHLHALGSSEIADLGAWRTRYHDEALSLFHGLQSVDIDLATARVIAASRFGGTFGRDSYSNGAAPGGAGNGLLNCLRQEYPQAAMRAVDFDGQSDVEIAELLMAELLAECSEPEVGYVGTVRHGSSTVARPLTPSPFPAAVTPEGDWVVLVTGGARGITAEIVEELVRPGMRVVLLGRTAAPDAEPADTQAFADAAQLKSGLLKQALARGEKPKPVEIERAVSRVLVDREIRHNLARLTAAGAQVEYLACDVRDEAALGAVIDRLYADHGRIDAVLHGAGVIEDKLFADKTAESFERVLGTKLDAAFVLSRKLKPASLKLLAFFTSVAGRYGNRGQGDYAAANETLNRLAWQLHREWPQTRVLAINWGPWDAGMASEGVRRAFKERGIEAIPVPSGRRFFVDEIRYGTRHDVEIVAGAGPWYTGAIDASEAPTGNNTDPSLPLVRSAPRMGPGGNMMLDHEFSLASDPYLLDHRIDGRGVLPAAGAVEWMAQFVTAAWPGWHVVEMRDVRQMGGVTIDPEVNGGKRSVQLRARASSHADHMGQNITVEIIDPAKKLPLYRATAVLQQQMPDAPTAPAESLDDGKPFAASDAYAHLLFHGPRFQLATSIPAVAGGGIDAVVKPCKPQDWLVSASGSWLFDPGLVDVAPQMAIVWSRLNRNMTALPSSFGAVLRYGVGALPPSLRLLLRMREAPHDAGIVYDALFIDDQNRVRLEMRHCEGTMSAALNRLGGQAAPAKTQPNESA